MLPIEIEQLRESIRGQIAVLGAELLDINFRRSGSRCFLTFIVDRKGGITLDECAEINARLGDYFDKLADESPEASNDKSGFISGSYMLEVNSPGLDRPLRSENDFTRALGDRIRMVYRDAEGKNRDYTGEAKSVNEGRVSLIDSRSGKTLDVSLSSIVKAVREISFKSQDRSRS
jgi:ribosome maturation factor RimP